MECTPILTGWINHRLEDSLMSEDYQHIEVVMGVARRRHWSTEAKLRIIEKSFEPGVDPTFVRNTPVPGKRIRVYSEYSNIS